MNYLAYWDPKIGWIFVIINIEMQIVYVPKYLSGVKK